MINARREDIAAHKLFQGAYRSRRCLIPVTGFFEWERLSGTNQNKQPYAIAMKDGAPFALAGLWEIWHHPVGLDIRNFAIVTSAPNQMMAAIHDRMPVVLQQKDYDRWLSPEPDPSDLMKPFDADAMTMWPITRRVTTFRDAGPDIINRVELRAT
ncbi:SOS response associated peptidase (SRAP) [Rhizobium aethiopicum]|uniref:Abasic site processing protein n=1 Tax=Rhizobium aethiopicum TaxID=1138170 RepID=A0A1C3YD39_9HYPH|nr:SOS response associated peptidase (SRAP) [Rhizobium aethiopicum]